MKLQGIKYLTKMSKKISLLVREDMGKNITIINFLVVECFEIFIVSCSNSSKGTAPISFPKGFL